METLELLLQRRAVGLDPAATIGDLKVAGDQYCYTLEDQVRDLKEDGSGKVYGETAIPTGRYKVIIDFSQRFQKNMLHILDVPWFTGIRIHSGNKAEDTLGCVLVGDHVDGASRIHGGSSVLPDLLTLVQTALSTGRECFITVANYAAPTATPAPSDTAEQA